MTAIDGLPGDSWRRSDLHQTVKTHSDLHLTLAMRGLLLNVRSPSSRELHRTARTTHGRTPRSQSDRTTMAARSSRDRGSFGVELPPRSVTAFTGGSISRLTHDRGPFEARLWLNSWPIWKPRRHPKEPLPRPLQIASTTASLAHDLRANFPFKNPCILPLFFNF